MDSQEMQQAGSTQDQQRKEMDREVARRAGPATHVTLERVADHIDGTRVLRTPGITAERLRLLASEMRASANAARQTARNLATPRATPADSDWAMAEARALMWETRFHAECLRHEETSRQLANALLVVSSAFEGAAPEPVTFVFVEEQSVLEPDTITLPVGLAMDLAFLLGAEGVEDLTGSTENDD